MLEFEPNGLFESVCGTVTSLMARGLIVRVPPQPGQKYMRYRRAGRWKLRKMLDEKQVEMIRARYAHYNQRIRPAADISALAETAVTQFKRVQELQAKIAEMEKEAKAAQSALRAAGLCRRGCGRFKHRGHCRGMDWRDPAGMAALEQARLAAEVVAALDDEEVEAALPAEDGPDDEGPGEAG